MSLAIAGCFPTPDAKTQATTCHCHFLLFSFHSNLANSMSHDKDHFCIHSSVSFICQPRGQVRTLYKSAEQLLEGQGNDACGGCSLESFLIIKSIYPTSAAFSMTVGWKRVATEAQAVACVCVRVCPCFSIVGDQMSPLGRTFLIFLSDLTGKVYFGVRGKSQLVTPNSNASQWAFTPKPVWNIWLML